MRVVLLGKGGSGKSTLAGLVCASLGERGERVVALDADSVPGLAQVLGMAPSDDWFLSGMAIREAGGWRLEHSPAETVRLCSRPGPGAVRFLQVGNADATMKSSPASANPSTTPGSSPSTPWCAASTTRAAG